MRMVLGRPFGLGAGFWVIVEGVGLVAGGGGGGGRGVDDRGVG
jgi:hypothetical protein